MRCHRKNASEKATGIWGISNYEASPAYLQWLANGIPREDLVGVAESRNRQAPKGKGKGKGKGTKRPREESGKGSGRPAGPSGQWSASRHASEPAAPASSWPWAGAASVAPAGNGHARPPTASDWQPYWVPWTYPQYYQPFPYDPTNIAARLSSATASSSTASSVVTFPARVWAPRN